MRLMACLAALVVGSGASGQVMLGPVPYLSGDDSPFDVSHPSFVVEDFEDGLFNVAGVESNKGTSDIYGPGALADSVDGDDGVLDGLGTAGKALYSATGPQGITFSFNPRILGGYPTHVGVVWTDGEGDTSFTAWGPDGNLLGTVGPIYISDGSIYGGTSEDRFFGTIAACGISQIHISNACCGMEVDHLQFSFAPISPAGQADFDADGWVDAADLAILLGAWGPCPGRGCCPCDLNASGAVDAADLAILLGEWTI
ncbi:MAG: hypothetical protein JNL80_15180 [Phycisphaerae bacterium]|jgi:hypothetical protein|nr:hypothetical protein [Phycisphaerae bacterium]